MRTRFAPAIAVVAALPTATLIAQSWPANMLQNGNFDSKNLTPWIVTRGSPRIERGPVNGTEPSGWSWCLRGCLTPGNPVELVQDRIRLSFKREYAIYFDLLSRVPVGAKVECQVVTIPQAKLELWTPPQIVTSAAPMRRGTIRFKVIGNPSQGNLYKVGLRISATARSAFRLDNVRLFPSIYPLIWIHPTVGGQTSKLVVRADPGAWFVLWLGISLWPPANVPPFVGLWELNPATSFPVAIGTTNQIGIQTLLIPIPRDKNVTGYSLYWQALQVNLNTSLYEFGPTVDLGMAYDWPVIKGGLPTWSKSVPPTTPPVAPDVKVVHDVKRGVDVLYQGHLLGTGRVFEFDGKDWKEVKAKAPGFRTDAALAYDVKNQKVVLFGGRGIGGYLAETWTYDGVQWTQLKPSTVPPGRTQASIAYDDRRGRLVLFGGMGAKGPLADTWEWDGLTWRQVSAVGPSARYGAGMCYDPSLRKVVLFGGQTPTSDLLKPIDHADTWTYDGSKWTRVSTGKNPSGRQAANQMVHLPGQGCFLYGGLSGIWPFKYRTYNDVWVFSGNDWSQIPMSGSVPAARFRAGMTYNAALGAAVLFGGTVGLLPTNETWLLRPGC